MYMLTVLLGRRGDESRGLILALLKCVRPSVLRPQAREGFSAQLRIISSQTFPPLAAPP